MRKRTPLTPLFALAAWLVVSGMSVRSLNHLDSVARHTTSSHIEFFSGGGKFGMAVIRAGAASLLNAYPADGAWHYQTQPSDTTIVYPGALGFIYSTRHPALPAGSLFRILGAPWLFVWLAASAVLLKTMATWYRRRTARRNHLSLCPRCGYDLRGTPERCPECGQIAERAC